MQVDRFAPPYKTAGAVFLVVLAGLATSVYLQFRGTFTDREILVVQSSRAGLVVDTGSKVTLNGVEIGRVTDIASEPGAEGPRAALTLEVQPRFLALISSNVIADVRASTVFGNKYVAFTSPKHPSTQRISPSDVITAQSVTTEFNTLFETVTQIAEQVDPVKLNQTLTATAEALSGLGTRFGVSLENGNAILDDVNPRMPRIRDDLRAVGDLVDVYATAAPDLLTGLDASVATARTLNDHRDDVDAVLMAAVGFGNTAGDAFERAAPYLVRGAADMVPTTKLLDDYQGMILCTIRNYSEVQPLVAKTLGGNGYSLDQYGTILGLGVGNAYLYPDNLPRINARGGPEGRPGCWQKVTKDLWPMPYLVMDAGFNLAPYNHLEVGSPWAVDYVWGRQLGEYTINP